MCATSTGILTATSVKVGLAHWENARWGTVKMQNVFPKLSATPGHVRFAAPSEVGQHNDEIYGERLHLNSAALADLRAKGVI